MQSKLYPVTIWAPPVQSWRAEGDSPNVAVAVQRARRSLGRHMIVTLGNDSKPWGLHHPLLNWSSNRQTISLVMCSDSLIYFILSFETDSQHLDTPPKTGSTPQIQDSRPRRLEGEFLSLVTHQFAKERDLLMANV